MADSGSGSLRQAIIGAKDGDTIDFSPDLTGSTIKLTSGELQVDKSLYIKGLGQDALTVDGGGTGRVFEITAPGSIVTIAGLTISGGSLSDLYGAGIENTGTLTLINSTVSDNVTLSGGGGIDNRGTLTLNSSTVSDNDGGWIGGGIYNHGTLTLINSTVNDNKAVPVMSPTFGGGILNAGTATVTNSTVSALNYASVGGGICNFGTATVTNSTISGNYGAGIYNESGNTLYVRNTILSGNTRRSDGMPVDLRGTGYLYSLGHNLIGYTSGYTGGGSGFASTDLLNFDPRLGPLKYNGGPTMTMALLSGSPAIDAGDKTDAPPTDQRGLPRVMDGNGDGTATIDIGAYELQSPVSTVSTTTVLTSSVNPSVYGQSVTFTATVTANSPGAGTLTGTVNFKDGTSLLGTGTLSGGTATFSTSTLAVGSHNITAVYGGDTNFSGSTSAALSQTVNKASTATTLTSSSANQSVYQSVYGQAVTLKATVAAVAPGSGNPTGTVTFNDGTMFLGTSTISNGVATFTTSALAVGTHPITAVYGSDSNFSPSTSALLSQTVNKDASTIVLTPSANPAKSGKAITFTATVGAAAPGSGTPTGTVKFTDGSNVLGTVNLVNGVATFTTSKLSKGSHNITAIYSGDIDFLTFTSAVLVETIQ